MRCDADKTKIFKRLSPCKRFGKGHERGEDEGGGGGGGDFENFAYLLKKILATPLVQKCR